MRLNPRLPLLLAGATVICAAIVAQGAAVSAAPLPADIKTEIWGEGLISTPLDELNTVFSPDGKELYWSVQLPDQSGAIVTSRLVNGKWTEPVVASFSGRWTDWDPFFTPDGKKLLFVSNRPKPGANPDGPRNAQDYDIWQVTRTSSGAWSEPENIGAPVNTNRPEYYPSIASDGTLYFSSFREGNTQGSFDLYRARFVDGKYTEPENLGPDLNSKFAEIDNYIAPDQTFIIFNSSGRPDDLGRGDLYISYAKDGKFGTPVHLPATINSAAREYCPIGSPDGQWLYFTSKRGPLDSSGAFPVKYADIKRWSAVMFNGGGNIYRARMSEVLAAGKRAEATQ